jgi:hypothetical protein
VMRRSGPFLLLAHLTGLDWPHLEIVLLSGDSIKFVVPRDHVVGRLGLQE